METYRPFFRFMELAPAGVGRMNRKPKMKIGLTNFLSKNKKMG